MSVTIKTILTIALLAGVFLAGAFAAGRFLGQDTGIIATLRSENDELTEKLTSAQAEITSLKEVNARLQADVLGGRTVEEERRLLENRKSELDSRENEVSAGEQRLAERESMIRQEEQEFYQATNLTQQEIGQAKQIQTEYEAMRQQRDAAQDLANRWLVFIWGASIVAFVSLLAFVVLLMRYWSVASRYRAETEQRQQAVQLLAATLSAPMTSEQKNAIVAAVSGIAGTSTIAQREISE